VLNSLDGDSSKIFYAERKVRPSGNPSNAVLNRIFVAVHPDIESEMRAATEILAKDECEFPIGIQSDRYCTYYENDGSLCHVVSIKRIDPPLNPVVLRSEGYEILDTHFLTFQTILSKVVDRSTSKEEAREHVREILDIIDKDIRERTGVEPALVLDGKVIWDKMSVLTDMALDELATVLSSHGMVGPNFVNLPEENLTQPVYFDFHGHPGYPERWLIPPSIGDIFSCCGIATSKENEVKLVIQAVALRLTTEEFQLFLRPYFKGEHAAFAKLHPVLVRIAYLHEVYNTSKERPIGEESWELLDYLARITALEQNHEIVELMKQLKELLDKADQDKLLTLWNMLIEKIENLGGDNILTKRDWWKKALWDMSGGVLC